MAAVISRKTFQIQADHWRFNERYGDFNNHRHIRLLSEPSDAHALGGIGSEVLIAIG